MSSGDRNLSCFLELQSWNSNFRFRDPVAMRDFSLGVPTWSSHRPHRESLSGTMLAPSSSTKKAVHICVHGCIHSGEGQLRQTILWGDSRRPTFNFAPHTCVNFMPIFVDQTSCLRHCFCCVYTAMNNKNSNNPHGSQSYMRKSLLQQFRL